MSVKLLNKIPVLDKGYVALHSCTPSGQDLHLLSKQYFKSAFNSKATKVAHINMEIKCPLFVQLTFTEHELNCFSEKANNKIEAFIPSVAEVNAENLEASEAIQRDIEQTTNALLINPKAYQSENCDFFISQLVSPISIYNTLLVAGSLSSWLTYVRQMALPGPIEAYRKAIEAVIVAEYELFTK